MINDKLRILQARDLAVVAQKLPSSLELVPDVEGSVYPLRAAEIISATRSTVVAVEPRFTLVTDCSSGKP